MLCNFVQERNNFCFYLSDINVLHTIKQCVSRFFFIKWNSILRKTTQKKIKLTRRSSNRRDCFVTIQISLCILNSTHSEVNIPLPYSQYSYFQFAFFSRTRLTSLNFSTVVLCSSQRGCNITFKHATGYRLRLLTFGTAISHGMEGSRGWV